MAISKKELAAVFAAQTAMLRDLAKDKPDMLKKLEDLEKKVSEGMGPMKTIGPCAACGNIETVKAEQYDMKFARWFMCPHKDLFCPKCLKKNLEAAKEARAKAKAEKKDEKKEDKKKK